MLRYDAKTGSFAWCSGKRYVQGAATTLQLTGRTTECKTADTPGTKSTGAALRDGDQKLGGDDTAAFQSALGSVMYVALDRHEILYSTKTVASFMQSPTKSTMVKLKRLVRYLVGFPQAEWAYSKQVVPKYLDVHGDSDWAGDEERKRSTTGVAEIFGGHLLDAVSVTQSLVALSGAEAEFYSCNRGTAGGLQTCHFLTEAVYKVVPRVWSDSSACRGIVRRTGSGRLRHLEIRHMWTQERLQKVEFLLKAVPMNDNVADLVTKQLAAARIEELLATLGVRRCTRGLVVASLITKVEANDFHARAVHVVTVSLAHRVMLLVVGCVVLVLALVALAGAGADCWWHRCCRDREYRRCSARRRLMQATGDVATWLVDTGFEEGRDQKTVARGWRAGTDGGSSSGTATRQATLGLKAGRLCLD